MDDLDDISDAYTSVVWSMILSTPTKLIYSPAENIPNGDREKIEKRRRASKIHDHAYFCLAFAQFEVLIRRSLKELRERKLYLCKGSDRAAWEMILVDEKMPIKKCPKLLLPNDSVCHRRFDKLCDDRNRIIHEDKLDLPLEVRSVIEEIKSITAKIRSALSTPEAAP